MNLIDFTNLSVSLYPAAFLSHRLPNTVSHDSRHPFSSPGIDIWNATSFLFYIPRAFEEKSFAINEIPTYPVRDSKAIPKAFFTANSEQTLIIGCSTLPIEFSKVVLLVKFSSWNTTFVKGIVIKMTSHFSEANVTRTRGCSFLYTSLRLRLKAGPPQWSRTLPPSCNMETR